MKIIYEIDVEKDSHYKKLFEISSDMYSSLFNIDNYLREIRKGWKNDDIDEILEKVGSFISESRIHEVE